MHYVEEQKTPFAALYHVSVCYSNTFLLPWGIEAQRRLSDLQLSDFFKALKRQFFWLANLCIVKCIFTRLQHDSPHKQCQFWYIF
ncbi:hypothetical protein Y1Q_0004246 [Alligator mississippiensis]|uniref:Uncharacterized protein n=1 Tax=Alligator mississippiensis TaxID=8496 RepID=A0A151MI52_ALLMI|nr:hypothetical protein Y1Q_0004246 [Alligator mississippiensis]